MGDPQFQSSSEAANHIYEEVRGQIQHEDTLITQRLNWFLTSQSFLFTAFAIVFNGIAPVGSEGIRLLLLRMIPILAIAAGALIFLSIIAGMMVMNDLRKY